MSDRVNLYPWPGTMFLTGGSGATGIAAITGGVIANTDISGGTIVETGIFDSSIDDTPIGFVTPSTGAFTTLSANAAATFSETLRLVQQGSTPAAPAASSNLLYSISSQGVATLAYQASNGQVVRLPGAFIGDTNNAWFTQPIGWGRGTTTSSSPALMRMLNTYSHSGGSALLFGAWIENKTATTSSAAEIWGLLSDFTHAGVDGNFKVATYSKMTRKPTAGVGQVWAEVHEVVDETGKPSGTGGAIVATEINTSADAADDGTLADGVNVNLSADIPGANRRLVDLKFKNFSGSGTAEYSFGVNIGADGLVGLTSLKNGFALSMAVTFAGLNMRRATFGASANGVLMQVGDNSTLAWTADSLSSVSTNYATIKGTGTAGNLGVKVTTLGTGKFEVAGDFVATTKTPASAAATGTAGTIAWDTNFIYVCTATDTWKRAAIATW